MWSSHAPERFPLKNFMATTATSAQRLRLAECMSRLGTESAFDVLVKARALEAAGREVIHLEIGEPDFPTPPHIVEAGVDALRYGWTKYGPPAGQLALREAVAEDAGRRSGLVFDPSEVVITPGAKPILFFTIVALVDRGDEVIYPDPGFPIYRSMIEFVGGRAVPYGFREEHDFDVDIGQIIDRLTNRTRLVILNSPHNPTGGVMPRDEAEELARALADRDLFVLSDEIYSRLIYEGEHVSVAQFHGLKDRTIILDGFSKTYSMTGWRLGYGIMRPDLAQRVAQLQTNATSCTASFTQMAGVTALRADQTCVDEMREEFRRRRGVMVQGLNSLPGFRCRQPHGAFYAFPDITGTKRTSNALADALLNDVGVAALSGTAFGAGGEGHLRFSFANSVENIQKALERMGEWVKKNV
jgi:aspartate/methionine/tyrosine aminotransferase